MNQKKYILVGVLFLLLPIVVYVSCFFDMPLSKSTSDWGAFGSYVGMGISALSIALIYITYNEQRLSNRIQRFEQHFHSMMETLSALVNHNKTSLERDYQEFTLHFTKVPFYVMSDYESAKVENVCTYYFSKTSNYDSILQYLFQTIQCVREEDTITEKEKGGRIVELACILPESVRVFYFCWLIKHDKYSSLEFCDRSRLFVLDNPTQPNLLADVIALVCTSPKSEKRDFAAFRDEIELDDYSNEPFDDTYNRLFNK